MKSFKKILAFALVLMLMLGTCAVSAFAADEAADEPAEELDTKIYFEVPEVFGEYTTVYCHLWVYGGESLAKWQSKIEKCSKVEDGLYAYNTTKVGGLEDGVYYGVIFSVEEGTQTYDTLMTSDCLGDTLYVDDSVIYENPQDSAKFCLPAFWRNHDAAEFGPVMQITSIGNVIGTCLPPDITAEDLFNTFLVDWLDSARTYTDMSDQEIIDNIADKLALDGSVVEALIEASGITDIKWSKDGATPDETPDEQHIVVKKIIVKDATLTTNPGEKPVFTARSAEPDLYFVYFESWSEVDGDKYITSADFFNRDKDLLITEFEEGKEYTYTVWVKPAEIKDENGEFVDYKTTLSYCRNLVLNGKSYTLTDDMIVDEDDAGIFMTPDLSSPDELGLLGDANGDGVVNVKDATLIQKAVAGLVTLDDTATALADADMSGIVNVKDATAIQKYVAGLSVTTPIGDPV